MKHERLFSALFMLVLTCGASIPDARCQTGKEPFTQAQYRWAVDWINGPLETLMAHDIIETVSNTDKSIEVLAGKSWQQLSFRQTGKILSSLSRARQITGHSPFFTVKQEVTGVVLARVTKSSIAVLMPGEGFMEYIPETHAHENTDY